ncbi:MAG TPA: HDOD domain-containing protein [Planctomycetaceae bacterium]|jgi:HD-like signal output (HDOD) protein/CheY-like chemotaxis protein
MSNRRIVAIFLADHDRAKQLASEITSDNVEPLLSESMEEFHRAVNFQRIDLVAIDNELPGFLTGLEILERLNGDLLSPPTILIGNLSPEMKARAGKLGIESRLPAGATIEALQAEITKALANANRAVVAIPPAARKLVLHSDVIRPLPQVLVKLAGYLDNDKGSIVELAKDIAVDPKITTELLKITNSTSFGLRSKVTKAFDAVNFLGIRRTVALVITSSVIQSQSGILKALPDWICKWYQQRSVLIASTAAAFAKKLEKVSPDTTHILGLLQDLGILVMAHGLGPHYQQLVERVRAVGHLRLDVLEKKQFEMTHADVSAALLLKWELPHSLVAMVANHHDGAASAACSKTEERFIHVMRIGEAVANLADKFFPQRYQTLAGLTRSYGAGADQTCKECLAEGVAKTVEASQLFNIPAPDEAALAEILEKIQAVGDEQAPQEGAADESASTAAPDSPVVLVIENDAATLEMIEGVINAVGLETVACNNSIQAKEHAPRAAAILCDFHLPSEQGCDVVRDLRSSRFTGPVIVMSNDCTRGTITKCIDAGMTDFVRKPVDTTLLLEKLSRHLGIALAENPADTAEKH